MEKQLSEEELALLAGFILRKEMSTAVSGGQVEDVFDMGVEIDVRSAQMLAIAQAR